MSPVETLRGASRLIRERATDKFMLSVADWLDAEADAHSGESWGNIDPSDCCRMEAALATANAYLRSES